MIRKEGAGALGRLAPSYYLHDGVVPRTRLPEVMRQVTAIARAHDLMIGNLFHAGDGNLHPTILFDPKRPGVLERVMAAGEEILRACVAAGGSITGEHGVGIEKRDYMRWVFSEADLEAMRQLQAASGAPSAGASADLSVHPRPGVGS